ncbi:MAG: pseudouridine synthase [Planctomycetes bacterium]|nr:pseudouridine synthase [Planctomycetota bacterium]
MPTERRAETQRLQKVLATAGVASRRACVELIREGRVEVDRQTVTTAGFRVDPVRQEIRVDGRALARPHRVYYLVNKPAGVVSTNRDPAGRPRVVDLVPVETRLFTVGRLDRSSEGLIVVTNDGELANQLSHPRYEIPKTYRAKVLGYPTSQTLEKLRKGVHLAEGVARVAALRVKGRHARGAELELVLAEGRNREIRRVLAKVGHKVLHLRRIAIGPIRLGDLAVGRFRHLTEEEVRGLLRAVKRASASRATDAPRSGSRASRPAAQPVPRRPWSRRAPASLPGAKRTASRKPRGRAASGGSARPLARPKPGAVLDEGFRDEPQGTPPRRQQRRAGGKGKHRE